MTLKRLVGWIFWLALLAAVIAAAGWKVYVTPDVDAAPEQSDVAYVIGPPTDARMQVALELLQSGSADSLMVSLDPDETEWSLAQAACAGAGDFARYRVLCDMPDPFTTRGEAQWLESEVTAHEWDSASVITFTPHIERAQMYMERCFDGELSMIDSGEDLALWDWAYQYAYQTGAFMKAGLTYEQC
ncbi:hypothetical protein [Demequina sp. NBRC 110051]|uniref:hypothetical protein n=1 Tax=Demequina sp. NBRC 110051 TaxID=1570340 RepID=UPI000A025E1B|nr:hypothetical protein [Demequina sp. NBRC 110051]